MTSVLASPFSDVLIARMRTDSEPRRGRLSAEHLKPHVFDRAGDPERAAPTDLAASPEPTASWWESGPMPSSRISDQPVPPFSRHSRFEVSPMSCDITIVGVSVLELSG